MKRCSAVHRLAYRDRSIKLGLLTVRHRKSSEFGRKQQRFTVVACLLSGVAWAMTGASGAALLSARDVTQLLFSTPKGQPPDLAGQALRSLDLAGLDFKKAVLSKADLFGADLSHADLSGGDLRAANFDRVTLIATRFDMANLEGASLLRPSAFTSLSASASEAPSFKGANMRGIKMFGRFTRANFHGADLTGATCAPFGKTGFIEEIWRTELAGADFGGATLRNADLTHALLSSRTCVAPTCAASFSKMPTSPGQIYLVLTSPMPT
jgi:uncharacterized protein YjbI with pentapeptide repeats